MIKFLDKLAEIIMCSVIIISVFMFVDYLMTTYEAAKITIEQQENQ